GEVGSHRGPFGRHGSAAGGRGPSPGAGPAPAGLVDAPCGARGCGAGGRRGGNVALGTPMDCAVVAGSPRGARSGRVRLRARADDRKSTRLNSSHVKISYAVFCLKKK